MKIDQKIEGGVTWSRNKFYPGGEGQYRKDTVAFGDWYHRVLIFNTLSHLVMGLILFLVFSSSVLGVASLSIFREIEDGVGSLTKRSFDVICFCLPGLLIIGGIVCLLIF